MQQSIENVSVGDWVTVISQEYREAITIQNKYDTEYHREIPKIDPEPLKVVAISTPFILGESVITTKASNRGVSIDVRFSKWSKLSDDFVKEYCRLLKLPIPKDLDPDGEIEKGTKQCPVCGKNMRERLVREGKNISDWILICNSCRLQLVPMD